MTLWVIAIPQSPSEEKALLRAPCIPMGCNELPDLSHHTGWQIKEAVRMTYPDETPERINLIFERIENFIEKIEMEDTIAVPLRHAQSMAYGRVVGPYHYEEQGLYRHIRPVEWLGEPVSFSDLPEKLKSYTQHTHAVFAIEEKPLEKLLLQSLSLPTGDRHGWVRWLLPGFLLINLILLLLNTLHSSGVF